jgi:hypothetical protein
MAAWKKWANGAQQLEQEQRHLGNGS